MKELLKDPKFHKEIKEWIMLFIVIAIFYGILQLIGITCPIKFATGISCAGCGMTRAWLSVFRLDFGKAFYYHPLFLLGPVIPFLLVFNKVLSIKVYKAIRLTLIIAFVSVYLYRLVFSDHVIVAFSPMDNALFRLIRFIKIYI